MNSMQKLLDFLDKLQESKIFYRLQHSRDDAIMVFANVPGERWEVEFFPDGNVEVEVFKSDGEIKGEEELVRLFRDFSD